MNVVHDLDDYQERAWQTAVWSDRDLGIPPMVYCTLKLTGEAGEFSEKLGKLYRDHGGELTDEQTDLMARELGDVLWYVANLARLLGFSLADIASMNLRKLADRKARGTLRGDGDTR
jgi:NTP pyrophosphatase (non-canonical NTP hydrolase)